MKTNKIRQNVLPLITAMIWGTAFVAQSVGAEYMGPFTFNAARAAIAFVFLLGLCGARRACRRRSGEAAAPAASRRDLAVGGLACGTALAVASCFQQKGLETTTSGKAGFITALYIVLVPLAGLLLGKKAPRAVWLGVVLAVAGLYCLCVNEEFSVTGGDLYVLACAFCFAVQIMAVDHFTDRVDGVALSCAQFLVMTAICTLGALTETPPSLALLGRWLGPVLYVGVFSSGVAYTLQILAQKGSDPTVVSLLMSMESVFATIAGALILGDRMTGREYLGCALMLAAVILAQLPIPLRREAGAARP
ncbi:DMT family transporter [uncultured Oscillibacter sp.]|uniref:DMT family transporter n=1 Tax=uncultured Oscillibacter sp. TaxID=876091 RepID=UPI0025E9FB8A|nr:DMT family transporter [uncultured Oscillibacter sp.]